MIWHYIIHYRAFSLPCRRKRSLRHEHAFVNARVVQLINHWCKKKGKGGIPHMNAALRKKNAAGNLRLHQQQWRDTETSALNYTVLEWQRIRLQNRQRNCLGRLSWQQQATVLSIYNSITSLKIKLSKCIKWKERILP